MRFAVRRRLRRLSRGRDSLPGRGGRPVAVSWRASLAEHLQRLGDPPVAGLVALGLVDPPRELLAVGVGERVERGLGLRVGLEG
jgi:hypothetical protein